MKSILDDLNLVRNADIQNLSSALALFPEHCKEGLNAGSRIILPDQSHFTSIFYTGPDGMDICGKLMASYLYPENKIPFIIGDTYSMPNFVNNQTLVVLNDYHGGSDRILEIYENAKKRQAQIISITSGGELLKRTERDGYRHLIIPTGLSTRNSFGYSFFSLLMVINRLNLISDKSNHIAEAISVITQLHQSYKGEVPTQENTAKKIAVKLYKRLPVILSGTEPLELITTRWRTLDSLISGNLPYKFVIHDKNILDFIQIDFRTEEFANLEIIIIRDNDDPPATQNRLEMAKESLSKISHGVTEIWTAGDSLLARLCSIIYLSDYTSYYLEILNQLKLISSEIDLE